MTYGFVPRLRLLRLKCDNHSCVLIDAGGTKRSDWPVRVLSNDVSMRTDRYTASEGRLVDNRPLKLS